MSVCKHLGVLAVVSALVLGLGLKAARYAHGAVEPATSAETRITRFMLSEGWSLAAPKSARAGDTPKQSKAVEKKPVVAREKRGSAQKKLQAVEDRIGKFGDLIARIDTLLADGQAFTRDPKRAAELAQQRSDLGAALATAEDEWLALSTEAESA